MEINFYFRPISKKERETQEKKQDTKDIERPVYMYISMYGERDSYNIKFKCKESLWLTDKHRMDLKKGKESAVNGNLKLNEWEQKVIDIEEKYKPKNLVLLFRILDGVHIEESIGRDEKEFFSFFENYINTAVPPGSIHNYNKCLIHLKSFSNNKYKIIWEILTKKFYQDYIKFLSEEYVNFRNGKKGILNSTIGKDIWVIKNVCEYAKRGGIKVPFDVEDYSKPTVHETRRHFITPEKLKKLNDFNFCDWELYTKFERMKVITETKVIPNILKVRDIYTFSFYTGLAHKEIMKIMPSQVVSGKDAAGVEVKVLDFSRTKTKRKNAIPLNKVCIDILEKYKGSKTLLPYFANSQYNRICKSMFKTAGFKELITITRWSGENEIVDTKEEWEWLTSHTGRHSAATNILQRSGDLTLVRDMLGHSSVKTSEIYAKNTKEEFNSKILNIINNETPSEN
jgi:site-specific recombinase XerD